MKRILMEYRSFSKRKLLSLLGAVVLCGGLGISLISCYPGDDISPSQTDIVATVPDLSTDFSTKKTYARPPDVCAVSDPSQTGCDNPSGIPASTEQQILASIDSNMAGMGFTPANPTDPTDNTVPSDVQVLPFATKNTWAGSTCYPYYWGGWYGGSGWCYPYTYTFTTGTLLIVMLVPTDPPNSSPIWSAGINGLLDGSSTNQINQRVYNAINQAFKQSSYLGAGK